MAPRSPERPPRNTERRQETHQRHHERPQNNLDIQYSSQQMGGREIELFVNLNKIEGEFTKTDDKINNVVTSNSSGENKVKDLRGLKANISRTEEELSFNIARLTTAASTIEEKASVSPLEDLVKQAETIKRKIDMSIYEELEALPANVRERLERKEETGADNISEHRQDDSHRNTLDIIQNAYKQVLDS